MSDDNQKCSKCDMLFSESKVKDYHGNGKRFRCFKCNDEFCSKCVHWCHCDNDRDPTCTDCAIMRGVSCSNCIYDQNKNAEINRLYKIIVEQMEEIKSLRKQRNNV